MSNNSYKISHIHVVKITNRVICSFMSVSVSLEVKLYHCRKTDVILFVKLSSCLVLSGPTK